MNVYSTFFDQSGGLLKVMNTQLVKIVHIMIMLNTECIKILIAILLIRLKGLKMYKAGVALNLKRVFPLFNTTKVFCVK